MNWPEWDGTAESNSQDQIIRRVQGQAADNKQYR